MKRLFISLLMTGTLFVTGALADMDTAFANTPIGVIVDGKQVQFDATPEVVEGRTMIPIRAVVETMGADVELSGRDYFMIKKGSTQIKIVWNSKTAYVNGQPLELPVPAYTKQERTYVPLRFVSEALAATVGYDSETNTAVVESFDPSGMKEGQMESIHDGETFRVKVDGVSEEMRLAGVDVMDGRTSKPPQPYSMQASQYLRGQLANRTVYLQYNPEQRDDEGRLLAYVYRKDGTFLNAEAIRLGYAHVLTTTSNRPYVGLFNALSREAHASKKGIWSLPIAKVPDPVPVKPKAPAKPASLKLAFPVISDTHVQALNPHSQDVFESALEDLYNADPTADALVVNGDLTNGLQADYDVLRKIVDRVPHPKNMFYVMGNHEYYKAWTDRTGKSSMGTFPNGETEEASQQRFLQLTGEQRVYYDKWVNGYQFIFLGSEKYRQSIPDIGENAYLSQTQLDWLKEKLSAGTDGKPVFVFLHQPLPYTVSGSDEELGVMQYNELREILTEHPEVILFSGHTHYELTHPAMMVRDAFTMVNSASVYRPYSPEEGRSHLDRSQGLYVEVHDSKVVIRGRNFASRMWMPQAERTIWLQSAMDSAYH